MLFLYSFFAHAVNADNSVLLTGKMTDNHNNPLENVNIILHQGGVQLLTTTADDGTYSFQAAPGSYGIELRYFGGSPYLPSGGFDLLGSTISLTQDTVDNITLSTVTLSGIVTDPHQHPISGATVNVLNYDTSDNGFSGGIGGLATTDNIGYYSMILLPGTTEEGITVTPSQNSGFSPVALNAITLVGNTTLNFMWPNATSSTIASVSGFSNSILSLSGFSNPELSFSNFTKSNLSFSNFSNSSLTINLNKTTYETSLQDLHYPHFIAVNPVKNKIYVAGSCSAGGIYVVDGTSNAVSKFPIFGDCSFQIAVNKITNKIYVTVNSEPPITNVIDGITGNITKVPAQFGAAGIAINDQTNKVYVANDIFSGSVSVINGTNEVIKTIPVGIYPVDIAVNTVTNKIYVANGGYQGGSNGTISVIDGKTDNVEDTITVGLSPVKIAIDPITNKIYVANLFSNDVNVIDGTTNHILDTIQVGNYPIDIAANPTINKIYVANEKSNSISIIDSNTNAVTYVSVGDSPDSIAINSITNKVYTANSKGDYIDGTISIINARNEVTTIPAGKLPYFVAVNPLTSEAYVGNLLDNSLSVISDLPPPNMNSTLSFSGFSNSTLSFSGFSNSVLSFSNFTNSRLSFSNYTNSSFFIKNSTSSNLSSLITPSNGIGVVGIAAPNPVSYLKEFSVSNLTTANMPSGNFPYGLFSWKITGLAIGQSDPVTFTFPSTVPSNAQYWKYSAGIWTNLSSLITGISGTTMTLTITDGGLGDSDGVANGQISDPGGLFIPSSSPHSGDSTPGSPPSFTKGFGPNEYPVIINGTPTNSNVTQILHTGESFVVKILLNGDNGPTSVQHVSLLTDLYGTKMNAQDSDTIIAWDRSSDLTLIDPHHFFDSVKTTTTQTSDGKFELDYTITFSNPMPQSDIIIRTGGADLYSGNYEILNAWQAVGAPYKMYTGQGTSNDIIAQNTSTKTLQVPDYASGHGLIQNPLQQNVPPALVLKGDGKFTYNGQLFIPFSFSINCKTIYGDCSNSTIKIGNTTVPINATLGSTDIGTTLSLYSSNLRCEVYDLKSESVKNEVVFDCTEPLGSGISYDASLTHQ